MINLVNAEGGVVLLLEKENKEFAIAASRFEIRKEVVNKKIKIMPNQIRIEKILVTEQPMMNNNFINGESQTVESDDYFIKNVITIPLLKKNGVFGIIEIYNKKTELKGFFEEDFSLICSLMDKIAVIIEKSFLFDRSEKKVEELKKLFKATEIVYSSLDLRVVLNTIMSLAMQLLNAEATSVLIIDEEQEELSFIAAPGEKEKNLEKIHLRKGEGIAGWVAENGKIVLVSDVSREPRFAKRIDEISGFKTKSILCIPLKVGNKIVGVIEAINKKKKSHFTADDIRLCSSLAKQSAMAIEKAKLYKDMEDLFLSTIKSIAEAIDAKDPYTRGHCERIRKYTVLIANNLGLSEKEKRNVEIAALLHDVGKIGVPETVLKKEGRLTEKEWEKIKKHPEIGAQILNSIKQLKEVIPYIRHHQEKFDGTGYPDGLKGREIPLASRIIAVVDSFDAMTSERPYRQNIFSDEMALKEIEIKAGSQFDPRCVQAFFSVYHRELKGIMKKR
jgi:putative nucleotidyltransferase with HDIG domain